MSELKIPALTGALARLDVQLQGQVQAHARALYVQGWNDFRDAMLAVATAPPADGRAQPTSHAPDSLDNLFAAVLPVSHPLHPDYGIKLAQQDAKDARQGEGGSES